MVVRDVVSQSQAKLGEEVFVCPSAECYGDESQCMKRFERRTWALSVRCEVIDDELEDFDGESWLIGVWVVIGKFLIIAVHLRW